MNCGESDQGSWPEDKAFLWLTILISLVFLWMVAPLHGAILWAVIIAILFKPIYRRLLASAPGRRNLAAFATLIFVILILILPLTVVVTSLVTEASSVYDRMQSGELNLGQYLRRIFDSMPGWASSVLDRFGLSSLGALKEKLSTGLSETSKIVAVRAVRIGQNMFSFLLNLFVMLYLLFFLLRDGADLVRKIKRAVPLKEEHKRALFEKFTVVIRATIKGNMVIAILQGTLGGLMFWFLGIQAPLLWGVLMAILALLPAVGAAVIWLPVAVYLLAVGEIWQGVVLLLFGALVISLVDNVVRPILVGKDTKMPDYVVLISTLGGIAAFGVNGFIIGPVVASLFISVWDIIGATRHLNPANEKKSGA